MKPVTAAQVLDGHRSGQFVIAGAHARRAARNRSRFSAVGLIHRSMSSENVAAPYSTGLSADQQVLDALISQGSEKVCDHGLPGDRSNAREAPNCAAISRPESACAIRSSCRATGLAPPSGHGFVAARARGYNLTTLLPRHKRVFSLARCVQPPASNPGYNVMPPSM